MAYETGGATGPNDLLTKFREFALANGWTINRDTVAGLGRELCISNGDQFYNFRSYEDELPRINGVVPPSGRYGIAVNGSDGYSAGANWDRQPGYPVDVTNGVSGQNQAHANLLLPVAFGPFPSYHFFALDDCLYLELEVAATTWQRLGVGKLELFNPAAPGGGRFFYATGGAHLDSTISSSHWLGVPMDNSAWAMEMVPFRLADYTASGSALCGSFLRAAFDSFDGWTSSARQPGVSRTGQACQGGGVHDKVVRELSPNPRNGVGVLVPNLVAVNRSNEFLSPVGLVPGMRYMDMTAYQPGEEFTLGPDTWKVFPWYQKGGLTLNRGIAYKKVV